MMARIAMTKTTTVMSLLPKKSERVLPTCRFSVSFFAKCVLLLFEDILERHIRQEIVDVLLEPIEHRPNGADGTLVARAVRLLQTTLENRRVLPLYRSDDSQDVYFARWFFKHKAAVGAFVRFEYAVFG